LFVCLFASPTMVFLLGAKFVYQVFAILFIFWSQAFEQQ